MTVAHEDCPGMPCTGPQGQRWYISGHAAHRYRERWEPYLTAAAAREKVARLAFAARLVWAPHHGDQRWQVDGVPDLVLVVCVDRVHRSLVVLTVLDAATAAARDRRSA